MPSKSRAEILRDKSPAQRQAILAKFSEAELAALEFDWKFWARPEQLEPPGGDWSTWIYCAGRGAGKTRTGAEWIRANMTGDTPLTGGRFARVALVGATAKDVREVMLGDAVEYSNPAAGSGILQVCPPDFRPHYERSNMRLVFPNGSVCHLFNADDDTVRGYQFGAAWLDEIVKFRAAQDIWDQLQFCMRLGKKPRIFVSTTPKPTKLIKRLLADPTSAVTRGSTLDNAANLPASYITSILNRYEGTRLGDQEIRGLVVDQVDGAMFSQDNLDANRIAVDQLPPLERIVIAVDPAVSSSEGADSTGIIAAGLGSDGKFYILDDCSGRYSPEQWARKVVSLYRARRADRVVVEKNQGGELLSHTLYQIDPNLPITLVHARQGKSLRAEPVSAVAEQNKLCMVGTFRALEDELTALTVDFDAKAMGYSPDRADAMVYAVTALIDGASTRKAGFIRWDAPNADGSRPPADAGRFFGAGSGWAGNPNAGYGWSPGRY